MDPVYAQPVGRVLETLGVDPRTGLSEAQARHRQLLHGPNRLREQRPRSAWTIIVDQFRSLIVLLLISAVALSLVTGDHLEAIAIAVVILLNAAIGFASELRAVRSMEALRRLGQAEANVRRDGAIRRVPAEELTPGDIVIIDAGDAITADLRIIESSNLQADESTLTGESTPVAKCPDPVDTSTILAERTNMLFKGAAVTLGSGECVVSSIGSGTELGQIAQLIQEGPEEGRTPLEQRISTLGRRLVWIALAIAALLVLSGLITGRDTALILKTSIALAIAAVPEGLPIVATLALARGMWRMVRRNALINRLAAVETLGSTTLIFSDKTGTLTENRMTVRRIATAAGETEVTGGAESGSGEFIRGGEPVTVTDDPELRPLLECGILCSNASWSPEQSADGRATSGEPMEIAIIVAGAKAGIADTELRRQNPERNKHAFDPRFNMMATLHQSAGSDLRIAVKGAPERVIDACATIQTGEAAAPLDDRQRDAWRDRNESMAASGLRILAIATGTAQRPDADPYQDLTLLGLVGLVDPPRESVRDAINACHEAGVRVVMVTGDQHPTARWVAESIGLDTQSGVITGHDLAGSAIDARSPDADRLRAVSVFARVSPEQKLDLIRLHQENGEIVAMTGDGVNDAPALRAADIGIAMGKRGTDVAREASDIILRDDAFDTIVAAIEQGRAIFDNIRNFIRYLVSCNLSEIIVVLMGIIAQTPLPILPLQILFLNLVTDVFPALALGIGEGDPGNMRRPPRDPKEPLMTRRHWIEAAIYGSIIAAAVLASLLLALHWLHLDKPRAVTVSFATLAFAQLWHVLNIRPSDSGILSNQIVRNPAIWLAIALCTALIVMAVRVPWLATALKTSDPGLAGWALIALMSLAPTVLAQAWLVLASRLRRNSSR